MNHGIDPSFRQKKEARRAQRKRQVIRRIVGAAAALVLIAGGAGLYLTSDNWSLGDEDEELAATDAINDTPADAPVYVPAIVDLAGDPMWITLARDSNTVPKSRIMTRPADLSQAGISPQIEVLNDIMLSAGERFMTTIPSSQEDFAFFQAQRTSSTPAAAAADDLDVDLQPVAPSEETPAPSDAAGESIDDPDAGWGETIDEGEAKLPEFEKTAIENNTNVSTVTDEKQRFEATEDTFVRILTNRSLESVAVDAHFTPEDGRLAGEALKNLFQRAELEPGFVVALRGFRSTRDVPSPSLMQVSVYAKNIYVGTLARNQAGIFVSGVDPWVREDLFNYSGAPDAGGLKRQYRLLDAIYSTAARNDVPTGVIGEAIMYLSRGQDLNAFAAFDQRLILIYSQTMRGQGEAGGRVLYVGVTGGEKNLECFVYQQSDGQFSCVTGDDQIRSLPGNNGMVTPVNGVMTSTFGPRMHPILKVARIHKGVDWAAPAGTPIMAAFDGKIVFQGNGGGYGNVVRIAHDGDRETRYAHMQRFAMADGVGKTVKAGEVIGYIGTTGLSTGPHLHFELYQSGVAINPLETVAVAVAVTSNNAVASDDDAVETLTDRIIHVESGGKARAKNPLSSASGAGQFIKSTWIKMMNTYRPDLARSLSTEDLLELRYDATISREMVRNLAREGEAYLRSKGHQITAGRLYLCHFLGMEGANQVLSAPGSAALVDVLGGSVIQANPFLTGKSTGYVMDWAERKMNRRVPVSAPSVPPPSTTAIEVRQTSPEFVTYKDAISKVIASLQVSP